MTDTTKKNTSSLSKLTKPKQVSLKTKKSPKHLLKNPPNLPPKRAKPKSIPKILPKKCANKSHISKSLQNPRLGREIPQKVSPQGSLQASKDVNFAPKLWFHSDPHVMEEQLLFFFSWGRTRARGEGVVFVLHVFLHVFFVSFALF